MKNYRNLPWVWFCCFILVMSSWKLVQPYGDSWKLYLMFSVCWGILKQQLLCFQYVEPTYITPSLFLLNIQPIMVSIFNFSWHGPINVIPQLSWFSIYQLSLIIFPIFNIDVAFMWVIKHGLRFSCPFLFLYVHSDILQHAIAVQNVFYSLYWWMKKTYFCDFLR